MPKKKNKGTPGNQGVQKTKSSPSVTLKTVYVAMEPPATPIRRWKKRVAGLLGTGLTLFLAYLTLFPSTTVEVTQLLNERDPFSAEFKVTNTSPFFKMYNVRSECILWMVASGNNGPVFDRMIVEDNPNVLAPVLYPSGSANVRCHFRDQLNLGFPIGYADIDIAVRYSWLHLFKQRVSQGFLMKRDGSGKPVWTYRGHDI